MISARNTIIFGSKQKRSLTMYRIKSLSYAISISLMLASMSVTVPSQADEPTQGFSEAQAFQQQARS
jgi:hypothetical protein